MEKIVVLIPCYNEALTIEKVVRDFFAVLGRNVPVYVYDNNSTDDTYRIAERAGARVRKCYQQGKGNVIRQMFREIDAECYLLVDGDDTYPADFAPDLIRPVLEKRAQMVVGDRLSSTYTDENQRRFHNFGNFLVRKMINSLFKTNVKDIMTGYRAFSYEFVKTFPVLSRGFEIETEMTIFAASNNLAMTNVVVDYRDRPEGSESKLNTFADGFKVLATIFNLLRTYRPMAFFGILALCLAIVGTLFLIPVLIDYGNTGLVKRFPTLIVCGFAFIAAIISLYSGMILDSIARKNRQDYELRLIDIADRHKDKQQRGR